MSAHKPDTCECSACVERRAAFAALVARVEALSAHVAELQRRPVPMQPYWSPPWIVTSACSES